MKHFPIWNSVLEISLYGQNLVFLPQHLITIFDPIDFYTLIYDCGVAIRTFWRRKKLMLVEENVKLMLHNQINVNSITAATSILNSALFWREKKYKMLITKFLVFSGKLLKHVLAFSSISSMTDVRVVLWIFFWVRWVSKTGWANFKKQKSGNGFCIWYNIRVKLEIRKADSTEF